MGFDVYAIIGVIVAFFAAWFKMRGERIDHLEDELEDELREKEVLKENMKEERKRSDFEADNREKAARAEAKDHEEITDGKYTL